METSHRLVRKDYVGCLADVCSTKKRLGAWNTITLNGGQPFVLQNGILVPVWKVSPEQARRVGYVE